MKATIDVPDELYRQVKAKSALEGRTVREVAIELFSRYVSGESAASGAGVVREARERYEDAAVPSWFGALERYARQVSRHDLEAIRESIGRGRARELGL